ncbi:MAG: biopolymer transporter ExbD [Planctomycetota bacterium]|nr:biopolymer transporter ExbD [Planctomycetota bacterium]
MRIVKPSGAGAISFNFTPMIDIVFNLLIFFVLTAQFAILEVEDVVLPPSLTAEPKDYTSYRNVVVNVVRPENPAIVVMGRTFNYMELTEHLKMLKQSALADGMQMNVILRADRKIPYEDVARVMLAAGGAEIQGWWIETDISDTEREAAKAAK